MILNKPEILEAGVAGSVIGVSGFFFQGFFKDHLDLFLLLCCFLTLVIGALFIINRHGRVARERLKEYHDFQLKIMRYHLAKTAWIWRRRMKELRKELEDVRGRQLNIVLPEVSHATRELSILESRVERLKANVQILRVNQDDLLLHFHERMERLEGKWSMSHDQAVARLALKGLRNPESG